MMRGAKAEHKVITVISTGTESVCRGAGSGRNPRKSESCDTNLGFSML